MNTMCWNYHGLGSSLTIRHLKDIIKRYQSIVIYLLETKNGDTFCDQIREQVRMDNAYYGEPRGTSEGLTLWWREDIYNQILTSNQNLIDCDNVSTASSTDATNMVLCDSVSQRQAQIWNSLRNLGWGRLGM